MSEVEGEEEGGTTTELVVVPARAAATAPPPPQSVLTTSAPRKMGPVKQKRDKEASSTADDWADLETSHSRRMLPGAGQKAKPLRKLAGGNVLIAAAATPAPSALKIHATPARPAPLGGATAATDVSPVTEEKQTGDDDEASSDETSDSSDEEDIGTDDDESGDGQDDENIALMFGARLDIDNLLRPSLPPALPAGPTLRKPSFAAADSRAAASDSLFESGSQPTETESVSASSKPEAGKPLPNGLAVVPDAKPAEPPLARSLMPRMKEYVYIQMEYCGSTLRKVIDTQSVSSGSLGAARPLDNAARWRILRQTTEALAYLHSKGNFYDAVFMRVITLLLLLALQVFCTATSSPPTSCWTTTAW
jgi:hypothetical protein